VGTPVLCTDLPVLREVNPLARFTNFEDAVQLKKDILDMLRVSPSSENLHKSVAEIATYEQFSGNLNRIIQNEK
jgi:hypothetical protein